ncbi:hypothetical protein C1645_832045 [Glomus cerebriforme]|uniref:Uncharacterized protein n=1 Tax=Glomus cerebriforme TaxID=658196 RepID=A0A397SF18_9GLOM|nr:hypothetical protein C1645_832045 [Glomus cerebriforme]
MLFRPVIENEVGGDGEAFDYNWKIKIWFWNFGMKSCLFRSFRSIIQHLYPIPGLSGKFKENNYKSFGYGYSINRIQRLDIYNGNTI